MTIAPVILEHFPDLNPSQLKIIGHLDGPLLVIAGPGSGKTYSIVLRALNLILLGKAIPREIVLCTFTEKAAFEMRDRLSAAAQKTSYRGDLSELAVSTIHSLCNRLLSQNRHRTELGHNYETLDELTQLLFNFDHFDEIIGPQEGGRYLGRWQTRWTAIEGARGYFDKITEELIEPQHLITSPMPFLRRIGNVYQAYEKALLDNNRVDFAHLQNMVYTLLADPEQGHLLGHDIRYVFQNYYHYTVITHRNRAILRFSLFNSFLRLLHEGGINEYEDPDQPFPKGHVQVMTIHQAKGLEFPVVVVGSLSTQLSSPKQIDRDLSPFCHRLPFEPEPRITLFDCMRLHYVAFSRPQKMLVLTAHDSPKDHFAPIWQELPQWPYVQQNLLAAQRFQLRDRMPVKRAYSFTGDLKIYETCPRQYQFFQEYDFTPSRSAVIFFGLLVHQTIEEIHRIALDGQLSMLDESRIRTLFERCFRFLCLSDVRPIGDVAREAAFQQVMKYFHQNQDEMRRIIQTGVNVSLEKDGYILTGKVDLLMGGDGKLEILGLKTSPRPTDSPALLEAYERQLCTYAHILERRHGRTVDRLLLYGTAEPEKDKGLMAFPYRQERIEEAGFHFDEVVKCIQAREFAVNTPPESRICQKGDLRMLCQAEGIIARGEREPMRG